MRTIILIIFFIISCNAQGQVLSIKNLLQKPIYVYYNDTLFTLDENCKKVIPNSYDEIYRLRVYPLCERKPMPWCTENYDYPYFDFSKIGSLIKLMPNLQELNLNGLPLWEFPLEILSLKRIQILDLGVDIEDCVENKFFSQPIPEELWKIKTLKYLYLPTHDYDYRVSYKVIPGNVYTIYYYAPWEWKYILIPKYVKFKINDSKKLWKLRDKYDIFYNGKHPSHQSYMYCAYFDWYFTENIKVYKTK